MADNGCRRPARTVEPGSGSGCQTLDKFDLANRAHLHGPIRSIHGPGLDERGGPHVVAAVHIGAELVKKIALVRYPLGPEIPEMMMRVADRDFGLQSGFLGQLQPVVSSVGHCLLLRLSRFPSASPDSIGDKAWS